MRLCEFTDDELELLGSQCLERASRASKYALTEVAAVQTARAAVFHELLDRRREDAARKRTVPAIKLAIAHVETLRDSARANNQQAAIACLDMQLELLKEYDKP